MSMQSTNHVWFLADTLKSRVMATDWRARLKQSVSDSGRSLRDISLSAGLGETYLSDNLRRDKMPKIETLRAVCDELGVSLTYILTGAHVSPEVERALTALASVSDEKRSQLLPRSQEAERGERSPQPGSAAQEKSGPARRSARPGTKR